MKRKITRKIDYIGTSIFDEKGKLILRRHHNDGYTVKYRYDSDGRLVHIENSNKEESFLDWDKQINIIKFIGKDGYVVTQKFDFDGNLLFHDNGFERYYYDKKGNLFKKEIYATCDKEDNMELNTKDKEQLRIEVANLIAKGHSYKEIADALEQVKIHSDLLAEAEEYGWDFISKYRKMPIDFIRKYKNKINWEEASAFQNFSEDELREFSDKIDWLTIFLKYELSKDLLYDFQSEIRNSVAHHLSVNLNME